MPAVEQVHIDAALTNLSVAYRNTDFIAEQLAPRVAVRKQSDRYYVYDQTREGIRPTEDLRAPGSIASEVDYTLSTDSYFCGDHALSSPVTDEERENADPVIQPDIDRTEFLTERILLNQEIAMEKLLRSDTSIAESQPPEGEEWSDPSSDPVGQIRDARLSIFSGCQRRANTLVLPYQVYEIVRNHPSVLERVRYGGHPMATPELLAQLFDVDRVLVPRSCYNSAPRGQQAVATPVWGANVYLAHVAPRAGLKQVTLANTFVWNGMAGSADGVIVERWREQARKAEVIRVQKYYDAKLISAGAGHRIKNVLG